MRIYIAGPISGIPNKNREAFDAAARMVTAMGHVPVSPIKVCRRLPENSAWAAYMKRCIPALLKCDAICMLEGWEKSDGAKIENDLAGKLGIGRFYLRRVE